MIVQLHRNYGYLSTDSFGQKNELLSFSITESMIKDGNGEELIEYSKEVSFEISKGVRLREREVREAINLKFDVHKLITQSRVKSKPYLSQVREKFKSFNINLPDFEDFRKEMTDTEEMRSYLLSQNLPEDQVDKKFDEYNKFLEKSLKTEDNI